MLSEMTQEHFTKVCEDEESIIHKMVEREGDTAAVPPLSHQRMNMNIEQTGSHLIFWLSRTLYLCSSLSISVSIIIGQAAI